MTGRERARLSLEGLSVGDTFGEQFFGEAEDVMPRIVGRVMPPAPWRYTDDTEMALSIVELLEERGAIDQDDLAMRFAERMDPRRGYGKGAYEILSGILEGRSWRSASRSGFRGMGSFGNGAAMRVAPLGAFFAESSLQEVAEQARLSAEVTHAHPEGIAGAIAVAVAAALAWHRRAERGPLGAGWMEEIRDAVPSGYTRDAIGEALALPSGTATIEAAKTLGNGSGVTAPDTVPFCLWMAAYYSDVFEEALWQTVRALGDRDTTCAIVGGILALKVGIDGIPLRWREAREPIR
ncbi:ADP-ribosylglycohydrolase family protein [Sorangium sp. So ce131]|uniref:ADP-ribosylglycohydrolase family protein n=1 Tax=Sorangium sp. So ce131 TaxID=3133282 RepID=UPI003F63D5DB